MKHSIKLQLKIFDTSFDTIKSSSIKILINPHANFPDHESTFCNKNWRYKPTQSWSLSFDL